MHSEKEKTNGTHVNYISGKSRVIDTIPIDKLQRYNKVNAGSPPYADDRTAERAPSSRPSMMRSGHERARSEPTYRRRRL